MPLDISTVSDVAYKSLGASLSITWSSTAPAASSYFQVYVGTALLWSRPGLAATIPLPQSGSRITIGSVDASEATVDFSATLPPSPKSRAVLSWQGGTFEAADLQGWRIFGETTPGGGINYTGTFGGGTFGGAGFGTASPVLADLEAYVPGSVTDGYGQGGFGQGGFGAASNYSWESEPCAKSGTWSFAIVPYDQTGNEGTGQTVSIALTKAPNEVPSQSDGARLHYVYNQPNKQITISWLQSTG